MVFQRGMCLGDFLVPQILGYLCCLFISCTRWRFQTLIDLFTTLLITNSWGVSYEVF